MRFLSWLRGPKTVTTARRANRPRFRPSVEALEDRWVPSTLTVMNDLDSGAGSLRAAIAAVHNGDAINFAPSLVGHTITLTSGELLIKRDVTIAGPGADKLTISGNHASRVFEVSSSPSPHVTLSGLTISDGVGVFAAGSTHKNDRVGGAILTGGVLTINNCTLSGNSASDGGAIHNDGTLTIVGSTLTGNSIVTNSGGGAIHNDGTLTVSGCTLSGNSAGNSGIGGAIYSHATLTVSASTLSHNSAEYGGGIYVSGTATIAGTTLSDNSADAGGGIFQGGGTLNLSSCTLSGNSAFHGGGINTQGGTLNLSGCILTGNSATIQGGGIRISSSSATVTVKDSSSITGNTAPVGYGPDVFNYGVLYVDASSIIGIVDLNPAQPI